MDTMDLYDLEYSTANLDSDDFADTLSEVEEYLRGRCEIEVRLNV